MIFQMVFYIITINFKISMFATAIDSLIFLNIEYKIKYMYIN